MPMHEKIARYFEGKEQFYPAALEAKYARIFSRIMELWETYELEGYFSDLMVDKRGGRQGFPPDVLNDLPSKVGLDFDLTQLSFGIFGFLLVIMMVLRPEGLIPERRRQIELSEGIEDLAVDEDAVYQASVP